MVKAVVVGAAGGIGQPLSLLLKSSDLITELALFDVVNAPGVATDLSHINTPAVVTGYLPKDGGMDKALAGADIVVIPAGIPRKPGMTREDLFKVNAGIVAGIAEGVAKMCPKAFILVISNPVNSLVSVFANVLKAHGVFDPKRLFGVTTLDSIRASTFAAEAAGCPSESQSYQVPVYCGHSGITIVPLFSQCSPPLPASVSQEDIEALTKRVMFGGDEVVKAKDGGGSATLSMAHAGATFALKLLSAAIEGKKDVVLPAYVYLEAHSGGAAVQSQLGSNVPVFSVPCELGKEGITKIHSLGELTAYEKQLMTAAIPELEGNIATGLNFSAVQTAKI